MRRGRPREVIADDDAGPQTRAEDDRGGQRADPPQHRCPAALGGRVLVHVRSLGRTPPSRGAVAWSNRRVPVTEPESGPRPHGVDAGPGAAPRAVGQVASLTGLRGFAALVVVTVHVAGRTDYPYIGLPGYGPVSLFVLSGFLLYQPWSRWALGTGPKPDLRVFARRRLARIFPAYLVVLAVVAVVLPESQPLGVDGWWRAIALANTTSPSGLRPAMEHTWSLGTELSWYLALPVLGWLLGLLGRRVGPRHATRWIVGVFLLSIPVTAAWRWWLEVTQLGAGFTYPFWLPGFLVCFFGGAAVRHTLEAKRAGLSSARALTWLGGRHPGLLVALAIGFAAVGDSRLGGPWEYVPATFAERSIRFVCSAAVALLLLIGAATAAPGSLLERAFSARWLVAIGRWSYGVYLWHLPVITVLVALMPLSGPSGFITLYAATLAISVPLGAATYAWIEQPAMEWSKRSPGVRQGAPGAVASQPSGS